MSTQTIDTSGRRLTIGAVRERLVEEFPDISISKIRYLEGQGLLAPRRTQSGYRLYSDEDVERLRTILQLQRDEFLPLRVIRDELMSPGTKRRTRRRSSAGPLSAHEPTIDLRTLCERSGTDAAFVRELEDFGILEPVEEDGEKGYPERDIEIVVGLRAAAALRDRAAQPPLDPKRRVVDRRAPGADRRAGAPFAEPRAAQRGDRRPRDARRDVAGAVAAALLARPPVARLSKLRRPWP